MLVVCFVHYTLSDPLSPHRVKVPPNFPSPLVGEGEDGGGSKKLSVLDGSKR